MTQVLNENKLGGMNQMKEKVGTPLTLVTGAPGSGKTNGMKWDVIYGLQEGISSIFYDTSRLGDLTENLIETLPESLYQVWDMTTLDHLKGYLCFPEIYQDWNLKSTLDKRVLVMHLVRHMISVFNVLNSEQMAGLSQVHRRLLDTLLTLTFSESNQTLLNFYNLLTELPSLQQERFEKAIAGEFLTVEDQQLYESCVDEVVETFGFLTETLGRLFENPLLKAMSEGNQGEMLPVLEKPQLLSIKCPGGVYSYEARTFVAAIINARVAIIYEEMGEDAPCSCQLIFDEVVNIGFGIHHQFLQILKEGRKFGLKLILGAHSIDMIKTFFPRFEFEHLRPTYEIYGNLLYSEDYNYLISKGFKEQLQAFVSNGSRRQILKLVPTNEGYSSVTTNYPCFNQETFQSFLIANTFKQA